MGNSPNSFLPLLSFLTLATGLVLSPRLAKADTLKATYGRSLVERAHRVQVERRGDDVVFLVSRDIRNGGKRVDEADLELLLPFQAVTSSLRTRQGSQWLPGRLVPKKQALAEYEHFTNVGPLATTGPALLSWDSQGVQKLRAFPIAAHSTVRIEYELKAPTCYDSGRRIAFYPKTENPSELPSPQLRLAKRTRGRIAAKPASLSSEQRKSVETCVLSLGSGELDVLDEHHIIVFEEEVSEPLRVRFGTHQLGSTRSLSELLVEVSPSLESLPKKAELVFVLDMSYSQSTEDIKMQIALIDGYLANLSDARYQLVLARRRAVALFPEFQPASGARRTLRALAEHLPERGNGSNLDVAVQLATTLFASKAIGAQRIIAFTDSELRETLKPYELATALSTAPKVLMHLIDMSGYSAPGEFERDDDHFLANTVQATGGMLGTVVPSDTRALTKTSMLALVRPSRIESVSIEGSEGWGDAANLPETLQEGFGFRMMGIFDSAPGPMSIKGKIWGRELVWRAEHHSGIAQGIPGLSVGRDLVDDLTSDELLEVATVGQVVSSATSYLARKPEVAPSSYAYDDLVMRGFGCCGAGSFHGAHHTIPSSCGGGMMGMAKPSISEGVDYGAALAGLLEAASVSCSVSHSKADSEFSLEVETTGREIVDVVSAKGASPYALCVAEAAWELRLGIIFNKHSGRVPVSMRR